MSGGILSYQCGFVAYSAVLWDRYGMFLKPVGYPKEDLLHGSRLLFVIVAKNLLRNVVGMATWLWLGTAG